MNASDLLPPDFNAAGISSTARGGGPRRAPGLLCEGPLTYAGVLELASRTGNALLALGVEMEDRVLMLCLDAPEFVGSFWGAIKIGAVPVPVNTLLRTSDYRYLLEDSRARVAVISAPLLAEAGPALDGARWLQHVLVAGEAGRISRGRRTSSVPVHAGRGAHVA